MAGGGEAEYVMKWRGERGRPRLQAGGRRDRSLDMGCPEGESGAEVENGIDTETEESLRRPPGAGHQFPAARRPATVGLHRRPNAATYLAAMIITLALLAAAPAEAVDCFKCSSRNGSNPACEDPFHNLNTTKVNTPVLPDPPPNVIYHTPCFAGRKGREGLFPASACIKLTGTFDQTGETLVVRHCALDSGTLTQDTELARMSHCGRFQFEGDLLKGCVMACPSDACNGAPPPAQRLAEAPQFLLVSHLAAAFLYLYATIARAPAAS